MQVIKVKLQNGVFVPLEPFHIGPDHEAVVVVSDKEAPRRDPTAAYYRSEAKKYFEKNFPELEASENILGLVAVLKGQAGSLDRKEYQQIKREVEEALRELPVDKIGEVLDFIRFLKKRYTEGELQKASDHDTATAPLHTMPASHLDQLTGIVEWGGDAFVDSERIYDDGL